MKIFYAGRIGSCLIASVLASCSIGRQGNALAYQDPVGDFVFNCYSINHAWGHQFSGFFISHDGNVYRYARRGLASKTDPIKQAYYQADELLDQFKDKALIALIDPSTMAAKTALIDRAASGTVTHLNQRVADAGQNGCVAYRFIADKNLYQPVELGSYGVTQIKTINSSAAAQALLQWLLSIRPAN